MSTTLLLDAMLSMPLSALLSYLLRQRYQCSRRACGAAFALGAYLAVLFSAAGLSPTGAPPAWLPVSRALPPARGALGNLFMLAPFALLTCLLFPEHRAFSRQMLLALGLSLCVEAGQVLLGRGTSPGDLPLNLAGAALGFAGYRALARLRPGFCASFQVEDTQCILYAYVLSALALLLAAGAFRLAL